MIKEICLQNFQAHKDTRLELHPGVNVITGSSNSGKSSILRGINWAVNNRPSGEAFVSHWAKNDKGKQSVDTSVKLEFDDTVIVRTKSGITGNTYTLSDIVLEAVGLDVPIEIANAINFTEVNTQKQHDAPFLLSESPGEVARFFNKIVHFDAIDMYLSSIESKKRKAKAEASRAEENATRLEEDVSKLTWVDEAVLILDKLEAISKEAESMNKRVQELHALASKYSDISAKLTTMEDIFRLAEKYLDKIERLKTKQDGVDSSLGQVISAINKYKNAYKTIQLAEYVNPAETFLRKLEKLVVSEESVLKSVSGITDTIKRMRHELGAMQDATTQIKDYEASLPTTCPMCGKEL